MPYKQIVIGIEYLIQRDQRGENWAKCRFKDTNNDLAIGVHPLAGPTVTQAKLVAYQLAIDELWEAVRVAKQAQDWEAVNERVQEAMKRCESARLALFDPGAA